MTPTRHFWLLIASIKAERRSAPTAYKVPLDDGSGCSSAYSIFGTSAYRTTETPVLLQTASFRFQKLSCARRGSETAVKNETRCTAAFKITPQRFGSDKSNPLTFWIKSSIVRRTPSLPACAAVIWKWMLRKTAKPNGCFLNESICVQGSLY